MDNYLDKGDIIVHIWTMLKTAPELAHDLADRIRIRRAAMNWSQEEAARRAGIAYRTWRRLETEGKASIEDLVKSAIALRCEEGLSLLFPEPAAASLDDLLKRQAAAASDLPPARRRAKRRSAS